MRGYFDEEEEPEAEEPRRDREVTLGPAAMLGIVLALLLLCGLCFTAGYIVGHRAPAQSAAGNAPTPAPDQEPLQASGSVPKPSASDQTAPPAPQPDESQTNPVPGTPAADANPATTANPTTTEQNPRGSEPAGSRKESAAPTAAVSTQPVPPAQPTLRYAAPPAPAAPTVRTALPEPSLLMVQIAAVANSEDADVLVTALRKRGFSVTARREPGDGLVHVRLGPFNSREEAIRWRDKLLGDGYNAVVQP